MPRGIKKADWDKVTELACDIANAGQIDDETLVQSKNIEILEMLDELQRKYGDHPSILATIGDYLDDPKEQKKQYLKALALAQKCGDQDEILEINDSLNHLED